MTLTADAQRLRDDTLYYSSLCQIVTKDGQLVRIEPNPAQLEFETIEQRQRAAGRPIRIIVLKARQVGISTWVQLKLIQRATLRGNHQAIVVAHDKRTASKIFGIGQRAFSHLLDNDYFNGENWDWDGEHPLKPKIRAFKHGVFLHFGNPGTEAWAAGEMWPDSQYHVDTAKEFESGRGATYLSAHLSELAFWERPEQKMTALMNAVPDNPETLAVVESTANGHNFFKEQWDLAGSGESDFEQFFWPWYKEPSYSLPFPTEAEREDFEIGEGRWAEREPELIERLGLTKEQLHWRRAQIVKHGGRIELFDQEYPTTPEDAFIGSGSRVFDAHTVSIVISECDKAQLRSERGQITVTETEMRADRNGQSFEVPSKVIWTPASEMEFGVQAPWRFWKPPDPKTHYVVGNDVSGGQVEAEGSRPAYNAIEVIDRRTGEQIAEYVSRADSHVLTRELYALVLYLGFSIEEARGPFVAIERTGGWGLPVVNALWHDFHYPFTYRSKVHGQMSEQTTRQLGWDTTPRTKPELLGLGQELLASNTHGIRSRELASEMLTYVRAPNGKTGPEPGKYSDRLMAWLIAQIVRRLLPALPPEGEEQGGPIATFAPRDPRTGY